MGFLLLTVPIYLTIFTMVTYVNEDAYCEIENYFVKESEVSLLLHVKVVKLSLIRNRF